MARLIGIHNKRKEENYDFKDSCADRRFKSVSYTKLCKRNGIRFKAAIKNGHPVEEIVNEAVKSKADLIVIGSHGSALKAAVLGSVTYGVIHKNAKISSLIEGDEHRHSSTMF